jgi:hypothetical protein
MFTVNLPFRGNRTAVHPRGLVGAGRVKFESYLSVSDHDHHHDTGDVLIPRAKACKMLGHISRDTLWTLEKRGHLTPVRLAGSTAKHACVCYRLHEVRALVRGGLLRDARFDCRGDSTFG